MITLEEAKIHAEKVNAYCDAGDDEAAMLEQGYLFERIVAAVARGCNQFHAQKLAKIALATKFGDL